MNLKNKYSRRELLEKSLRYAGLALLGGVTGILTAKNIFGGTACRAYSRCAACKDASNCSLAAKGSFNSKWKVRETGHGRK